MSNAPWTHQDEVDFRLLEKRRTRILEARKASLTAALGNCPGISADDIPRLAVSLVVNAAAVAGALTPFAENQVQIAAVKEEQ